MSPNLEGEIPEIPEIECSGNDHIELTLTPLSDLSVSTSVSEEANQSDSESNHDHFDQNVVDDERMYVPLEHNIRELLIRITNTEHLETVTQIKLRVIARELALQQLGLYLPALRELTLDGGIVSSLRDLGHGLKNLKVLRVNRCQLPCIDGVFGLEELEELYAADNLIKDLSPCAFLSKLKVVDVRRNLIKSLGSLWFLNLCNDLNHLLLEGNEGAADESVRQSVKRILPGLVMLDDAPLLEVPNTSGCADEINIDEEVEEESDTSNRNRSDTTSFTPRRSATLPRTNPPNSEPSTGFMVRFPPKVCNGTNRKTL